MVTHDNMIQKMMTLAAMLCLLSSLEISPFDLQKLFPILQPMGKKIHMKTLIQ